MVGQKSVEPIIEEFVLDPNEPAFTTGVVCKLLNIPIWVLKQLDREGVVSPPRASESKSRLYSTVQIKKLKKCWYYMDEKGVNIKGLRIILNIEERIE